ncbi:MAG TPA: hypothetical protein VN681_12340 [Stellaceae bacterium]|nr:hypothetical protein [Stellaceae bacterium]
MADDYDGLGFTEAVRLCVARAHSLTKGDTNFLMKINHPDRSIRPEEKPRLGALVRRLRQGDLVDLAYRPPAKEDAPR